MTKTFTEKVIEIVRRIPKGKTMTYAAVAKAAGSPHASRAVGNIMNRYGKDVTGIPCHRVVRSDGSVGGYKWGSEKKIKLLKREHAL